MCPGCGHPLGEGCEAWTVCKPCGYNEPGASSTAILRRLRVDDPYRKPKVDYFSCERDFRQGDRVVYNDVEYVVCELSRKDASVKLARPEIPSQPVTTFVSESLLVLVGDGE